MILDNYAMLLMERININEGNKNSSQGEYKGRQRKDRHKVLDIAWFHTRTFWHHSWGQTILKKDGVNESSGRSERGVDRDATGDELSFGGVEVQE